MKSVSFSEKHNGKIVGIDVAIATKNPVIVATASEDGKCRIWKLKMKSKDWKTKVGVGFAKTGLGKFGRRIPSFKQIATSYLTNANEGLSDTEDDNNDNIVIESPPTSPRNGN